MSKCGDDCDRVEVFADFSDSLFVEHCDMTEEPAVVVDDVDDVFNDDDDTEPGSRGRAFATDFSLIKQNCDGG